MKTILRSVSLGLACGLPASLAAQMASVPVPAPVDAWHLFLAFVAAMTLQTLLSDYAPVRDSAAAAAPREAGAVIPLRPRTARADHALAA